MLSLVVARKLLPLNEVLWNFIVENLIKIYGENRNYLKFGQKFRALCMKAKTFKMLTTARNIFVARQQCKEKPTVAFRWNICHANRQNATPNLYCLFCLYKQIRVPVSRKTSSVLLFLIVLSTIFYGCLVLPDISIWSLRISIQVLNF